MGWDRVDKGKAPPPSPHKKTTTPGQGVVTFHEGPWPGGAAIISTALYLIYFTLGAVVFSTAVLILFTKRMMRSMITASLEGKKAIEREKQQFQALVASMYPAYVVPKYLWTA